MAVEKKPRNLIPEQDPAVRAHNFDEVTVGFDLNLARDEASRCLRCAAAPCMKGCPVGVRIPEFLAKVREGKIEEAGEIIKSTNSLPSVCGRVCPQENQCEKMCVRARIDGSVSIGGVERFVGDYMLTANHTAEKPKSLGKRVAVVGSGPSGLTCASQLAAAGVDVTVYEAFHKTGGVLVYASKPHSYRDLPIRAGEIGLVHRHEMKGALHGLFRVRCFNQDDAHLFVRPDQLTEEIVGVVKLIDSVYQQFGFTYHVELSTRPEDSMGSDEDWAAAEAGLKTALEELGMEYEVNEGDGAFYGPKIDFHLEDSLGRTWQCGTVQLDFQMPLNFDLEYVDADGTKKRPIMLHRVCFGSIERFIGILIEHFAGKFPTWLAPVQVKALPVSEKSRDYAHEVCAKLEEAGIRVVCDDRDEKIGYKIREARSVDRVPYMLILGEKEVEAGNISVRDRSNETVQMSVDEFVAKVLEEIKTRA